MRYGRKATLIWTHETHRRSGLKVASLLLALGYTVEEQQLHPSPRPDLSRFTDNEIIISATGGRLLNHIINSMTGSERPIIISVFPGILVDDQIEALLTRVNADVVCMNSQKDLLRFNKVCRALGVKPRGLLTGPLWSFEPSKDLVGSGGDQKFHVFAEQDFIPDDGELAKLGALIADLARRFPKERIALKGHPKSVMNGIGSRLASYDFPSNVEFTESASLDWARVASLTTISSSLALIAVLNRVPTHIVSDFGTKRAHTDYFTGSGLLTKMNNIDLHAPLEVELKWVQQNVTFPELTAGRLQKHLLKRTVLQEPLSRISAALLALNFPLAVLGNASEFFSKIRQSREILQTSKS